MKEKSCLRCIHKEVCKFLHGEMARWDYTHKDFRKELVKLQKRLAGECKSYLEGVAGYKLKVV